MWRTTLCFILECLPILVLFVAGQYTDFFTALWYYLGSVLVAIIGIGIIARRFPYISVIFGSVIIASSLLSHHFNEPDILIFADSLYFFVAASALAISQWYGRNLMKFLFQPTFSITEEGWRILLWRWVVVLLIAGISNEIVRLTQTPEFWIDFQFYRSCLVLLFACTQFTLTRQYRIPDSSTPWGIRKNAPDTPVVV
jgi:intracellular septation protein